MIASVLNSFKTDTFVQALMDKRSELRESLLNMSSSIMITNIMAVNQIITSISQLTEEAKEVNTKSQHIALTKLREVSVALTKHRKGIIGSVESEKLSSGILESLSNVLNASLIQMDRFAAEIPLPSVDVLKNTLSVLETVTDAVSFGKVPGETETSMVTNNFRITLKREEKWDLSGSHRKTENTFPSFFLKLHDNESTVPVDAIVTYAFYEFLEDPLPWLKNGRDIDTVITGFYMVAPDDTGRLMNLHPTQVDVIMKRKNIPPVFDIWVSPDVHKTTSGIFCFEVDQTSEAEWFVQFFYAESIIFDISLHIGDNITNNPVAFFRIPNSEEQAKTSEDENIKTWNSKMIRIPLESFPEISLIHNITIELTTTFVVWRKTKLLRASIFNIACLDFEDMGNNWNEGNCKVGNFSNNTVIHCICEGLTKAQRRNVPFLKKRHTFLSARVFVLPNPIDLTKVTVRSLQSNLVTLLSVLVICVTYLGLSMWARKKDISDQTNRDAIRLPANSPGHEHRYSVTIYTGSGFGSGTTAEVYLEIMGTERNHRVLCLTFPGRQLFRRGGIDTFIFTTSYPLGDISKIRIWHDNTGNSPGWFLSRVKIEKMFSDQEWFFVCQAWLDAERHYGLIHRSFSPMNTQQPLEKSEYFYIILSCRLKEEHLCFSVFLTNLPLALTRFQRLSCSFVILMCSLLINIIFFNAEKSEIDEPEIQVIRSFMVGLQSSTVMFFIEWLVDKLIPFSALTKTSLVSDTANQDSSGDGTTENSSENIGMESRVTPMECLPTRQRMSHNNCVLPEDIANQIDVLEDSDTCTEEHPETQQENVMLKTCYNVCNHLKGASCFLVAWGSKYVVWGLLFSMTIISAVLIILYGLSYGFNLSMMWLTASVTCFFQNGFLQIAKTVFFSLISCIRPKYCKDIPWPCRHMSKNSVLEIQRCYS
ncbi:polycystin family receptor for egg jelly [Rhinoderma darwinii]|uniref:polycystin family receptor for egg jelly n=1 Tax=Rhinoderma darwinii TaxID=43563 RepID=UPI003F67F3CF